MLQANNPNMLEGEKLVKKDDLISVIIPVYKVENYLCQCIESILNQDYKNLEIILIDDGSPDDCGHICDNYAQKDNRIIVIHKENGGLSDARNVGLFKSKGTYITFIDSDDSIESNFVSVLYELCITQYAELAFCHKYHGDKRVKTIFEKDDDFVVFSSEELLKKWHSVFTHIETTAWGKIYHRSLFQLDGSEPILYEKGRIHEDVLTTHRLVYNASKIAVTNKALYHYTVNPGSITNKAFSSKRFIDMNYALEKRTFFFKENNFIQAYHRLLIYTAKGWILGISKIKKWKIECKDEVNRVQSLYCNYYDELMSFPETNLYEKALFFIFKNAPFLCTDFLVNIYLWSKRNN